MQCKNIDEIIDLLTRLDKNGETNYRLIERQHLSLLAIGLSSKLWIDRAPENEDTEELRRQLTNLTLKGVWAIEG